MGAEEVNAFLSHLAVDRTVSASTLKSGAGGASVLVPGRPAGAASMDRRHRAGAAAGSSSGGIRHWNQPQESNSSPTKLSALKLRAM